MIYNKEVSQSKCQCDQMISLTQQPTTQRVTKKTLNSSIINQSSHANKNMSEKAILPIFTSLKTQADHDNSKTTLEFSTTDIPTVTKIVIEKKNNWINIPILAIITGVSFLIGILTSLVFYQFYRRKSKSQNDVFDGYDINNQSYYRRRLESGNASATLMAKIGD
ncbi:uncharacterized protein LOC124453333 isoform X3 [Xenia sp. Carnegie-2017]|nr:uncharacterized protein LOC124453333 isoform X3 [Xenia sp. Carnegie-2017]